jgi:hypothetical protein
MQISDLNNIGAAALRDTEAVFHALVCYPNGERIEGASVDGLMDVLDATCLALTHDTRLLPRLTRDVINTQLGSDPGDNYIYSMAAAVVRKNREIWRRRFRHSLVGRD